MTKIHLIDAGSKAAKVLDRQEKALSRIVAFALVDQENGESLGSITGRYPKDGAGVLHLWLRLPAVSPCEGKAGGCGYNKMQAALYDVGEALDKEARRTLALEKEYMGRNTKEGRAMAGRICRARITAESIRDCFLEQSGESDLVARLAAQKINMIRVI